MTGPAPLELHRVIEVLRDEFTGTFAAETVAECVLHSHRLLTPARVQAYLPLLAYRFARERLLATALLSGWILRTTPVVLFVCTHNAGRSQLAEALLAHHAGDAVTVFSAGTHPAEDVDPQTVAVLGELGIDARTGFPKPLTDEVVQAADVVVTMGCGDTCPLVPGPRYLDWDLPDPVGLDLAAVRTVRDDIDRRIQDLLAQLNPALTA